MMSEGIIFFVDVNIKKGMMSVNQIEKELSAEIIEVIYAFGDTLFRAKEDKGLIKQFDIQLKQFNSGKNKFEGFFITHDKNLREDWNFLRKELSPNLHLIEIRLSGEAEAQYQQRIQQDFWREENVNVEQIPLVRKEIKNQIVTECERTINEQ